jgi:hypothetical protein
VRVVAEAALFEVYTDQPLRLGGRYSSVTCTLQLRGIAPLFSTSKTNLYSILMEAIKTKAYGATNSIFNGLAPMEIERFPPKADEVHIDILYCGVCNSD